jgi:hypothetical protein
LLEKEKKIESEMVIKYCCKNLGFKKHIQIVEETTLFGLERTSVSGFVGCRCGSESEFGDEPENEVDGEKAAGKDPNNADGGPARHVVDLRAVVRRDGHKGRVEVTHVMPR